MSLGNDGSVDLGVELSQQRDLLCSATTALIAQHKGSDRVRTYELKLFLERTFSPRTCPQKVQSIIQAKQLLVKDINITENLKLSNRSLD